MTSEPVVIIDTRNPDAYAAQRPETLEKMQDFPAVGKLKKLVEPLRKGRR
jgi:hypothetical protein